MKAKFKASTMFIILGFITAALTLFPMYIMLVNSFKGRAQIFTDTIGLPKSLDFSYYISAIEKMKFLKALSNSLFVTIISIVLIIIFSSMSAWAIVRSNSKLANFILYTFIATMLVPFQSVMIPLMQYMSGWEIKAINFSMIDTFYGLIFMYIGFGSSLSIFSISWIYKGSSHVH